MREDNRTPTPRWGGTQERERCLREARRYLSDADAEDAVQEALLRAWRKRDAWVPPDGPIRFLLAITRRESLRALARPRLDAAGTCGPMLDVPADDAELEATPLRLTIAEVLAGLPQEDRALLELRYGEDLTHRALASRLGIPEGTVKVRLHRLRARLRVALEGEMAA